MNVLGTRCLLRVIKYWILAACSLQSKSLEIFQIEAFCLHLKFVIKRRKYPLENLLLFLGLFNDYWSNRLNERNLNLLIESTNKIYVDHIIVKILIFIQINIWIFCEKISIFSRKNFQIFKEKTIFWKKNQFFEEKNQYFVKNILDKLTTIKFHRSDF